MHELINKKLNRDH